VIILDMLEECVETLVSLSTALVRVGELGVGSGGHEVVNLGFVV
jgi:hypothetical protein